MKFLNLNRYIVGITFIIFFFCLQPIFTHANNHIAPQHLTPQSESIFTKGAILAPQPVQDENWYLGATPKNIDYNKFPIVFVHGLHGHASEWWGGNEMYGRAYNEGFRTAFVSLSGESNNWNNGKQLANILEKIYNHFNGKVNIVAHSKGGIDTQTALVHFGAHSYVNNVITLSTPFHGTALADLAYSAPAKWLMKLLGKLDPGTESLQTANMNHFRKITDFNQNTSKNTYYTAAGTDWGSAFSASWFGGVYLSKVGGPNDGQVSVSSAQLPYGNQLFVAPLTHENMHQGSAVFEKINPTLQKKPDSLQPFSRVTPKAKEIKETNTTFESTEQFINGGILPPLKTIEEKISIDSSIHSTNLYILTKNKDIHIEIVSPSKKKYNTKKIKTKFIPRNEVFGGSYLHSITINQPEEGDWKLYMSSVHEDAYFMLSQFNSNPMVEINMDSEVKTNTSIPLQIKVENPEILDMDSMKINIKKGESEISKAIDVNVPEEIKDNMLVKMIPISNETSNLNITIEIEGKTKQNTNFKRTEVRSIHVSE
ncbi:esterase/lipase family protein [Bacillus cereus]|uniref:esterase/lipase family protein n=1 Tax=Bacillus cereus TaxID=1396 RepID=UPI00330E61E3|nr:lipase [Bacillus cereus]